MAVATLFSADEPDLLRGPQHDLAWCDELAAGGRLGDAWSNLLFGLRIGSDPRCVISTTPRPLPLIRDLIARDDRDVAVTRMTTFENLSNLAPGFAQDIVARYAGTRLGRQELSAEILEDVPRALWTRDVLEKSRLRDSDTVPDLARIVVGVDPALTASEGAAETGIVVVGVSPEAESRPQEYFVPRGSSHSGLGTLRATLIETARTELFYRMRLRGEPLSPLSPTLHVDRASTHLHLITDLLRKLRRSVAAELELRAVAKCDSHDARGDSEVIGDRRNISQG